MSEYVQYHDLVDNTVDEEYNPFTTDVLVSLYEDMSTSLVDRYYELHPWEDSLKSSRYAAKRSGDNIVSGLVNLAGEAYWSEEHV